MKYAAITTGILLAIAALFFAVQFFKSRKEDGGGFWDWVKNPDYRQAAADYFKARKSLHVPDVISDEEIQRMVDRLFVQKDEDFNLDRLRLVGAKAVPFLIKALDNQERASARFADGHAFGTGSPFERIVDLLEPIGPADAARPLAKFMDHEDDHFREQSAFALGNIGTAECIVPMLKALDDDDYVRSYAMAGIQRGMEAKRCTPEFLDAMIPALTKLLNRDDESISGAAPELLLAIDKDRAMPILLSPEFFTIRNEEVHYIIRALNAAGHAIPHDTLLPFLKAVKPLINDYPHDYEYAEALLAYAKNPDAFAEQTFRTEMKSPNEKVQKAAAEALAILSGVTDARDVVVDALNRGGFDQLSLPQRHYYAVFRYNSQVNNGGHAQYFVNSSGDHCKSAIEGLEAMGAEQRAKILREAASLFGAAGPSTDGDRRQRQLAAFSEQQDKSLNELDKRYYSCSENIEVLLAQYALLNKQHFISKE
jgi:HEAT repeat protein